MVAEGLLDMFEPISLAEMKQVRLMNRVDEKYLLNRTRLDSLLRRIGKAYYVQRIDGEALADYHTLYYDTAGLAMYTVHHNRKLKRQKLRVRRYRSNNLTYFEVKDKNNKGKTHKTRIEIAAADFYQSLQLPAVRNFIAEKSSYPIDSLMPQLENRFTRITLVDKGMHERVTIDSGIRFHNFQSERDYDLSPLVIMEVKREAGADKTPIDHALTELRIHPRRMSKYCIGTVLTNPKAKYNRFKDKIRYINELATADF
ncbi:MAG: hypothetical protein AUK63_1610 [bacterium P3]|nr:MAG: hypothetical protein AUK63_1610 [bacterium P3]KWW38988.1 MAG: hypothetical protein F083_1948 [bacterium F083]